MSTVIIIGGDGVRQAVTNVENASVGWSKTKRDAAAALFNHVTTALQAVADGGDPAAVTISGP